MDKPEPDGYVIITFTNGNGQRYDFKDTEGLREDAACLRVMQKDGCISFPWANIESVWHKHNSDEYVRQLNLYQAEHDHNWVEEGPVGFFGQEIAFVCGPNKLGTDQGCGAYKTEPARKADEESWRD